MMPIRRRPVRKSRPALETCESRLLLNGSFDPNFADNGAYTIGFDGGASGTDEASDVAVDPRDGSIVFVGYAAGSPNSTLMLGRLTPDGRRYPGFDLKRIETIPGNHQEPRVAIDIHGRIIVAASVEFSIYDVSFYLYGVQRHLPDGRPDQSFNTPYGAVVENFEQSGDCWVRDVVVDLNSLDQDFYVIGDVPNPTAPTDRAIGVIKYNGATGDRDTNWGDNGRKVINVTSEHEQAAGAVVDDQGRLYIAGQANFLDNTDMVVVRLTSTGAPDPSFGRDNNVNGLRRIPFDRALGGGGADTAAGLVLDPRGGGSIVVAGTVQISGANTDFGIARLDLNGNLVTSFGQDGKVVVPFDQGAARDGATGIALDSQGRIVVVGQVSGPAAANDTDMGVARLTPQGTLDATFDQDGRRTIALRKGGLQDGALGVTVDARDGILIAGRTEAAGKGMDAAVVRLLGETPAPVTVSFTAVTSVGYEVNGVANVVVRRTGDLTRPLTVPFGVVPSSALAGHDYLIQGGQVTFGAGQAEALVTIPLWNDATPEGLEYLGVVLAPGAGYTVGPIGAASVAVVDDDPIAFTGSIKKIYRNRSLVALELSFTGPLNKPSAGNPKLFRVTQGRRSVALTTKYVENQPRLTLQFTKSVPRNKVLQLRVSGLLDINGRPMGSFVATVRS